MQTTRRDLFKFLGGSAVGVMFTPAPWRLITDTALWSENWPGIPRPASGEIKTRYTHCALCPAGCAVRARLVGSQPVALMGVPAHPLSLGALCPFGLTGHQLPYHPERLKQGPEHEASAAVAGAIAQCAPGERIAVLDLRPGRTASWTYRRAMAAVKNGVYLTAPQPLEGAAVNLAAARTVLSIGAPVMEGWGTPGNVLAARAGFRLIQAEPLESRTASLADLWLRIKPGSGRALALSLIAQLEGKAMPAQAAAETGLGESQIADLAGELARNGPALVLAGDDVPEAVPLNRLTGAWGKALMARAEAPVPDSWKKAAPPAGLASVPDGSIRALLIDESVPGDYIPWNAIAPKLVPGNPVVVVFAWSRSGYGRHAQFTLPAAVYPEMTGDAPAAIDSPAAAFRIFTPLVPAPSGMVDPAVFIASAAGIDASGALRERADAIHKAGRGTLFTCADVKSRPVKELKPEDFWKALNEGGCWMDAGWQAKPPAPLVEGTRWQAKAPASQEASELPLLVALTDLPGSAGLVSPLMSKLYQESNLRLGRNRAALNPASAAACGVGEGAHAMLQTVLGQRPIQVTVSPSVPPGMVEVGASPEILDICGAFSRARVAQS
ncbi:MAG: hypothetical protein ABSF25_10270 [Bryobacteraceae bacterium]